MNCNSQIIVDPPSEAYYENKFFLDSEHNRDDCLLPNIRLRIFLKSHGVCIDTFDLMPLKNNVDYYSFGIFSNIAYCLSRGDIAMKAFFIMEPPCVEPKLYAKLPELTKIFETVYVHNIKGNGYSLDGVDESRLKKLYWAQSYNHVLEKYWSNVDRFNKVVVINSNKKPKYSSQELYSERIRAIVELSKFNYIDLYGMNWRRLLSTTTLWPSFIFNRGKVLSVYKGVSSSKYETLSKYEYCLCYENDIIDSYITEKIFDCFYVGTIPIYLGPLDIDSYIPKESFIDSRDFKDYAQMYEYLHNLSKKEKDKIVAKGREFIEGKDMDQYYNSLINIFEKEYID